MKKLFNFLLVLFLLPIFITTASAEASVDDQYCDNDVINDADHYWVINWHTVSQTFSPTKNRLTSVLLALAGGTDVIVPVKMDIYQVGGGLVLSQTASTTSELVSWIEYTFPAVSMDVTKQYRIDLTTTSNTAKWILSNVECYSGGYAIVDDIIKNGPAPDPYQDFGFVTYGYNYLTPSVTNTPTLTVTPSLSPTPVDIVKPNSLTADYLAEEGVKLVWSASSTTGIEGYNIYRSKGDTENYINIASVEADTNIYYDENVEEGMTYYYTVKAYISENESPSSPVAEVLASLLILEPSLIATPAPKSLLETIFGQYVAIGIVLIVFIIVAVMVLTYYLLEKRGKKKLEEDKEEVKKEDIKEVVEKDDDKEEAEVVEEEKDEGKQEDTVEKEPEEDIDVEDKEEE